MKTNHLLAIEKKLVLKMVSDRRPPAADRRPPTAGRRPPAADRRPGWFSAIRERIFANFFLFDRSYRDLGAERIFKAVTFKLTDIKGKLNFILLYLMGNSCIGFKA